MSSGPESGDENDLEIIQDGDELVEENNEVEIVENQLETNDAENQNDGDAENKDKKIVKPKRVIKNPQPRLNEQTIKGSRGLAAIEGYFERVKFKGRGYEEQDLNVLMKTYEYWCHRLFPKFPFDDCIARLEKLGTKRATLTQIKRIRMDINFDEEEKLLSDEGENDTAGFVDTLDTQFDELLPNTNQTTSQMITDEQLERMRENKEKAERLRQERLRKIREKAQGNLGESNHLTNTQISGISTTNQFDESVAGCSNERNMDYQQERIESEDISSNRNVEDEEDTDNILTNINSEENNSPKRKRRVIESDSEDDLPNETSSQNLEGNKVNERENGSTDNIETTVSRFDKSVSGSTTQNDQQDKDEDNIDNILSQINTEEKNSQRKKRVINSDSEDELTKTEEATNVKNLEIEIAKEAENESINNEDNSNNQNDLTKGHNEIESENSAAAEGDMEVEDDIENILSQINTEENSSKSTKQFINSSSETESTTTDEAAKMKKLENDTVKEVANGIIDNIEDINHEKDSNNQNNVSEGQDKIGMEDAGAGGDMEDEDDIDNILSQINTEEDNSESTKNVSTESESTVTDEAAKIKKTESDTAKKEENRKINNIKDKDDVTEEQGGIGFEDGEGGEDIDNILSQINTEEDNSTSTKNVSRESESTITVGTAKIKIIESDTAKKAENGKINNIKDKNDVTEGQGGIGFEDDERNMKDEDIDNILSSINTEENNPKKKYITENDTERELVNKRDTHESETIKSSINQNLPTDIEMESNRDDNMDAAMESDENNISETIRNEIKDANINKNGINTYSGKFNLNNLENQQQNVESDKENDLDGMNASDNNCI